VALTSAKTGLTQEEVMRRFSRGELSLYSLGGAAAGGMALPQQDNSPQRE